MSLGDHPLTRRDLTPYLSAEDREASLKPPNALEDQVWTCGILWNTVCLFRSAVADVVLRDGPEKASQQYLQWQKKGKYRALKM